MIVKVTFSNYSVVINDCGRLLTFDIVIYDVSFIRRQDNKVAHSLATAAPCNASFVFILRIHLVSLLLLLLSLPHVSPLLL